MKVGTLGFILSRLPGGCTIGKNVKSEYFYLEN